MEEALNLGKKSSSVVEDVVGADQGDVQGKEEEAVDERTPLLKHWILELITFEILAAERLRLMGFDNRLIIDWFGYFLQKIDSEVKNMNPIT